MKRTLWIIAAVFAAFALLFAACKGADGDGNGNGGAVVTDIIINGPGTVDLKSTANFTAIVMGDNLTSNQAVTWDLVGTYESGTTIISANNTTGRLTVASGETAKVITIRATSRSDSTVTQIKDVAVVDPDNAWKVTFELDGGTIDGVSTNIEFNVTKDTAIPAASKPSDPVKAGFMFTGWFQGDTKYNFNSNVTTNITLKAGWAEDDDPLIIRPLLDFTISSPVTLTRGETFKLEPTFVPPNASNRNVSYVSGDPLVAAINPDGTITAGFPGRVYITATPAGNTAIQRQVVVNVRPKTDDDLPTFIGLKLSGGAVQDSFTVGIGDTLTLIVDWGGPAPSIDDFTWEPKGGSDLPLSERNMAFSKAFPYITTSNPVGRPALKGIGPGTQDYTITSRMDPDIFANVTVTVTNKPGFKDPIDVTKGTTTDLKDDSLRWGWAGIRVGYNPVVREMVINHANWFMFKDDSWKTKYAEPWQSALDAAIAGKTVNVVVYYTRDLDKRPPSVYEGWAMEHVYTLGIRQYRGGLPTGTMSTQPVWRHEITIQDFLNHENYVCEAGNDYRSDFLDVFQNTYDCYEANQNKGINFQHFNLARVSVGMSWGFQDMVGGSTLQRVEIEMQQ